MITGYDPGSRTLTIGIGSLIEFGRLPESLVPQENPVGVQTRQRIHSRYQAAMVKQGWEREVQAQLETEAEGIRFVIRGRMDLLSRGAEGISVIEVKTASSTPAFDDPFRYNPHHVLQLAFYARAMEAAGQSVTAASLVYLPMTRGAEPVEFPIDLQRPEVSAAWDDLIGGTAAWLTAEDIRRAAQAEALSIVRFPYETLRPGQAEMVEAVEETIAGSGCLMLQAPTGTGKTAAVLTGGLRASLPTRTTLFFLTAKNTHKRMVVETAGLLIDRGLPLRMLVLTSRESLCARGREICFPDDCPFAREFRARVTGSGVMERLLDQGIIGPENLFREASEAGVCPFELGLCLSTRCDLVCGDYNYVYDPHVFIRRFFLEPNVSASCAILVDEAANLPARARDYYSPQVKLSWILALGRWKGRPRSLARLLKPWRESFAEWDALPDAEGRGEMELPRGTPMPFSIDSWQRMAEKVKDPPRVLLDVLRSLGDFARLDPSEDGRFHLIYRREGSDRSVQWFCTDPSEYIAQRTASCRSTVAFSATLSPLDHFRELLGLSDEGTELHTARYPFPEENLGVWVDPRVDTRWSSRVSSADILSGRLAGIYRSAPGTWLVFMPSFSYLELIRNRLLETDLPVIAQTTGMGTAEREDFLEDLTASGKLALVVSGGIFAEGVDIRSDLLRGAVVVGPSLPGMDLRSRLLAESYRNKGSDGFLHALAIPGMVRVIQAAGRLVRSPLDRRVLVLMGRRFTRDPYFGLIPPHWFRGGWLPVLSDGMDEVREFFAKM